MVHLKVEANDAFCSSVLGGGDSVVPHETWAMHLVVTGGAGFIGGVVGRHLLREGHRVSVLDNLSSGCLDCIPRGAQIHLGDIGDRAVLDKILPGADAVLHFAASIEVNESMGKPLKYFRNNLGKAITLLEAMSDHGIDRLVFSSTAAVYGQPQYVPVDEHHITQPQNPYGESKLMMERVLAWMHDRNGLKYASLRYFNAAGGTQRGRSVNLIPIVLDVARGRRPYLEIFGTDYPTPDGTAIRDYIHVEDLATAHSLALSALDSSGRLVYNLGNGVGFSVREVVEVARRVTGHPIPVREMGRRHGDPAAVIASSTAIRDDLGWSAKFSDLQSIIASAWREPPVLSALPLQKQLDQPEV